MGEAEKPTEGTVSQPVLRAPYLAYERECFLGRLNLHSPVFPAIGGAAETLLVAQLASQKGMIAKQMAGSELAIELVFRQGPARRNPGPYHPEAGGLQTRLGRPA